MYKVTSTGYLREASADAQKFLAACIVYPLASWQFFYEHMLCVSSTMQAMLQICGESNVTVFNEAAAAGVARAAFVSVHDYNVPGEQN